MLLRTSRIMSEQRRRYIDLFTHETVAPAAGINGFSIECGECRTNRLVMSGQKFLLFFLVGGQAIVKADALARGERDIDAFNGASARRKQGRAGGVDACVKLAKRSMSTAAPSLTPKISRWREPRGRKQTLAAMEIFARVISGGCANLNRCDHAHHLW